MRTFIVDTLEASLTIVILLIVGLGALAAADGLAAPLQGVARGQGWSIATSWDWRVVAAVVGALIGFLLCSVVFGVIFVLLDLRAQAVRQTALLDEMRLQLTRQTEYLSAYTVTMSASDLRRG